MPKDSKKNRYFQIGMGWESWTLSQLEADAKLHQMDDQPAKLIVLRLTEYYKLVERGVIVPGITAMMQSSGQQPQLTANGHSSNGTAPTGSSKRGGSAAAPVASKSEQQDMNSSTVAESADADQNADEALDFFMMDDGEEGNPLS